MVDSGALRVRRARAHKAGDHSLCRRCAAVRSGEVPPAALSPAPQLPAVPVLDPQAELRELAARLVVATRVDTGNALLAAELRKTLLELIGKRAEKPDDELAGLFSALQA